MKKTILTIVLFLSLFFVSSNVFAAEVDNGTVSCQYYREVCDDGDCRNDSLVLRFNISDGQSKLTSVTTKINKEITDVNNDLVPDNERYETSITGVTDVNKCPQTVSLIVKEKGGSVVANGDFILSKDESGTTSAPSWLGGSEKVSCANIGPFSKNIPRVTSLAVTVMLIIATALFVIMGTVDFFKASMSGKDEIIKKNQKAFIDRLIAAILLFLIVVLAKLFISIITNALGTNAGIVECIDCFINNKCK